MVYSDATTYPLYPWIQFVTFVDDCPSDGIAMLDCAQHAHFVADFPLRKIRSVKPVDWRVVVNREVRVATVGLSRVSPAAAERRTALRAFARCLACCLARRGW